jgi:hypothetical protein
MQETLTLLPETEACQEAPFVFALVTPWWTPKVEGVLCELKLEKAHSVVTYTLLLGWVEHRAVEMLLSPLVQELSTVVNSK